MPGQEVVEFFEGEPERFDFLADLRNGHLVFGFDRDIGVFGPKFDEDELSRGFEGFSDRADGGIGVGHFVVDIDHEGEVDLFFGEFGVGLGAEDRLDVLDVLGTEVVAEHLEHLGLDIGGEDSSGRAHDASDSQGMISDARADVGDGPTRLDFEGVEHGIGLFFLDAFGAHEPISTQVGHDIRDGPALIGAIVAMRVGVRPARGAFRLSGFGRSIRLG